MASPTERSARRAVLAAARHMEAAGHSPGSSGNVSVRLGAGLLITPSGIPPSELRRTDLVRIDAEGRAAPDSRTPSSELPMHRAVYGARPDVGAVVHSHSRFATALACLRRGIPPLHYMVAAVGGRDVPCADYATFGSPELSQRILEVLGERLGCLLANHGQLALGADLPHALRVAEEIERLAFLTWSASLLGEPVRLGDRELAAVEQRFREGYGQPPEPEG